MNSKFMVIARERRSRERAWRGRGNLIDVENASGIDPEPLAKVSSKGIWENKGLPRMTRRKLGTATFGRQKKAVPIFLIASGKVIRGCTIISADIVKELASQKVVVGGVSRRRSVLHGQRNRDLEIPPTRDGEPLSYPWTRVSP